MEGSANYLMDTTSCNPAAISQPDLGVSFPVELLAENKALDPPPYKLATTTLVRRKPIDASDPT